MSWSVDDINKHVLWLTNKNQAGGISSDDLFYMWNTEQSAYQEDLLGKWQNRNNGKSGLNTGLILNETTKQKLSPFTVTEDVTIVNGTATKPSAFIYEVGIRMNATGGTAGSEIIKINQGQIPSVNKSVIDSPSVPNDLYYTAEYEDYYSLFPSTVAGTISLDYIAECRDIKWGYSFDTDGRQVYNPGISVQPQWGKNTIIEITKRALKSLGVHFKDSDFMNFGKENIMTGD